MSILAYFKGVGLFADQRTVDEEIFKEDKNGYTFFHLQQKLFISRGNDFAFGATGKLLHQEDDVILRDILTDIIDTLDNGSEVKDNPVLSFKLSRLGEKLKEETSIILMTKTRAFLITYTDKPDSAVIELTERGYYACGSGIRQANVVFHPSKTYNKEAIHEGLKFVIEFNGLCGGTINSVSQKKLKAFKVAEKANDDETKDEEV